MTSNALEPELPEIDVEAAVEEDVVAIQAKVGEVGVMVAFPNDGQDHTQALGFLAGLLPQIITQTLNQLEAE